MEIAATGPLALGTASTGHSGGDSPGGAFASVLGALGAIGTTAPAQSGGVSVVPPQTTNVPLIVGATAIAAPADGAAETLPAPAAGEEAVTLPLAPDAQVALPAPAGAEVKLSATGAKPGISEVSEKTVPMLPASPPQTGETEPVVPVEISGAEIAPEAVDDLLPQPHLPAETSGEAQPEAQILPLNDAALARILAEQARPQGADKGSDVAQDAAFAIKPQEQAAHAEAGAATSATPDAPVEQGGDAFAKMVPGATERAQPQPNSAPLPSAPLTAQPAQLAARPAAHEAQPERHPTISFRPEKMAKEMGLEIARRVSAGGDELVIRMDPAELGRINVRMAVNEQGQLRAIVSADMPTVLEALRSDLSQLNRALEQAGVRTDAQSFRFDQGGGADPGSQWQQRYQQQASGRNGDAEAFAMAEDEIAWRPMATNGRVNMMA